MTRLRMNGFVPAAVSLPLLLSVCLVAAAVPSRAAAVPRPAPVEATAPGFASAFHGPPACQRHAGFPAPMRAGRPDALPPEARPRPGREVRGDGGDDDALLWAEGPGQEDDHRSARPPAGPFPLPGGPDAGTERGERAGASEEMHGPMLSALVDALVLSRPPPESLPNDGP